MLFLNRKPELSALAGLGPAGGLAVVWGRRRIGKTRLLLEWCERERGVYTVADQAGADDQRAYLARALAEVLPGFADVTYPSWERLLARLAADAVARRFTGPIVIDEVPYLVASSPDSTPLPAGHSPATIFQSVPMRTRSSRASSLARSQRSPSGTCTA